MVARLFDGVDVHGVLQRIECRTSLFPIGVEVEQIIRRKELNFRDFKRIQNSVGESVATLTSEMPTNSSSKVFRCLTNVDWLTVEVVKRIHSDTLTQSFIGCRLNEAESCG